MAIVLRSRLFRRFVRSKCALALPVTFLILLVSTLGIITVTYYFAVENINTQSEALKVSTAQQDFVSLDNVILSTLGQPGSSSTIKLSDSGGSTNIKPTSNILTINVNDNSEIDETIFNSSVGQVTYELPCSGSIDTGLYLEGDSQTITNQSGSSPSQLYVTDGPQGPEIQLQYRPTVTYATAALENGQAITNVRIYIVNLNSSDPIALQGQLPLQISCTSTQLTTETYQVSNQPENLAITSQLNGANGSVSIPISTPKGSIIYIETVISNVSIQRWIQ
ncbi:MAG: hypothetical protein ABSA75_13755 [Candidatus Bathyarchaeia archaeon]